MTQRSISQNTDKSKKEVSTSGQRDVSELTVTQMRVFGGKLQQSGQTSTNKRISISKISSLEQQINEQNRRLGSGMSNKPGAIKSDKNPRNKQKKEAEMQEQAKRSITYVNPTDTKNKTQFNNAE